ncbi:MAG: hypothetical protein JNL51_11770 [Chitinophagaceae bacterium]|nr:hypothetical protein [Chitinophagaceae bacterium]
MVGVGFAMLLLLIVKEWMKKRSPSHRSRP